MIIAIGWLNKDEVDSWIITVNIIAVLLVVCICVPTAHSQIMGKLKAKNLDKRAK